MKVSALQEFLHSLGGSLAAVEVQPRSVAVLRAIAHTLAPFADLDLEQFAEFLKRAAEYRVAGQVTAVSVPGLDDVTSVALKLGEELQAISVADVAAAGELENRVANEKRNLQAALGTLVGAFGVTVKFTDDKKWVARLRMRGAVAHVAETIRRLLPQITGPESYRSEAVRAAVDELERIDTKILKAAGDQLGVSGTGSGRKLIESVLTKLTGIANKPSRAATRPRREEPSATDEQLEALVQSLQGMVERAKDPNAVSDSEIEAVLSRVSTGFSSEQQKLIAKRVTGKAGRSAQNAIDNLRDDLTAVKRLLESQKV